MDVAKRGSIISKVQLVKMLGENLHFHTRVQRRLLTSLLATIVFLFVGGGYNFRIVGISNILVVTNPNDGEPGSLRVVIKNAPSGSVITFSPSLPKALYIDDYININKNLAIHGLGAKNLTISSNGLDIIFATNAKIEITDITLALGHTQTAISGTNGGAIANSGIIRLENVVFQGNTAAKYGGAVYNGSNGHLFALNCTFLRNQAVESDSLGGAIANEGVAVLINNTFYRNSASKDGGAIYNSGNLDIIHSTIWGNKVLAYEGSGLAVGKGRVSIKNSIVAGNFNDVDDTLSDISGTIDSLGYNIIQARKNSQGYTRLDFPDGLDPLLDTSDSSFDTFQPDYAISNVIITTIPLKANSPAANAIPWNYCRIETEEFKMPPPSSQKACNVGAIAPTMVL